MSKREPRYQPGQRIGGRYLVHKALMGGMGEVYLCLDEQEMAPITLKTFQGSTPALRAIFEEEVAHWVALEKHPNIVQCYWMQILDNRPFMGLEWIASSESRGADLRSWLQHGPLELHLALRFTIDIVRGLQHADEKVPGIVHCDLKPDNVLVNQSRQAKITDWGLATVAQRAGLDLEMRSSGEEALGQSPYVVRIVGTPAYMPPEQWRGETDLDFRTDLYSVGCILYELLTGKRLYDGGLVNELRVQHLDAPIPTLSGTFPSGVKRILDGCLAKRRNERFEQLDLLLGDIQQLYECHCGDSLPSVKIEELTAADFCNRGVTFAHLGQHERAIADYDEAIRLNPAFAQAYSNRANSYGELGQHERAIADCDEAIRLDPIFAGGYHNRGASYAGLGQHERAITDFDEAIHLNPTYARAYSNRARSCGEIGQREQAIVDCNEAIRLDPTLTLAYSTRTDIFAALGLYQQAIADCDQILRLDPTDAVAYYNRGNSYADLGQHARAIIDCNEAIRLDPNFAKAYYNRGNSYGELGQHEQAIVDFDEAIRLDPGFAKAYINRGNSFTMLGQYERAIADYDKGIDLDPTNASAYFNKGATLTNIGRLPEALPCFEKAHALGAQAAVRAIQQISQKLGMAPLQTQAFSTDPQAAFEAFQRVGSLAAMRLVVQRFSLLTDPSFILVLERLIQQQVSPEYRPMLEYQLAWLKHIVEGK